MADFSAFLTAGLALIIIGVIVLVLAAILIAVKHGRQNRTRTSGIIIIGPVPIIFGSKKDVKTILILSIALTALLIAGLIVYYLLYG